MKQRYFILTAAIAAALFSVPNASFAQPGPSVNANAESITTSEAPRVTQTVINSRLFAIPKTHLAFVSQAIPNAPLQTSTTMSHLQLVLKPSPLRAVAMETLIASQHDPRSVQFDKWLTPQQFGDRFGLVDSDVAAVTAWLKSQGFTVNSVYPNKMQIDFTGTVAQVNQAFHTKENIYTLSDGSKHLGSASDISVPAALQFVVAGVMGLNNFHPGATTTERHIAHLNATKTGFVLDASASKEASGTSQAISIVGGGTTRALVPNDLATIYGIKTLRANGVTGKGINIAVVESQDMDPSAWSNFVSVFNLGQYGGTFQQINPAPVSGPTNCEDPGVNPGYVEGETTIQDAEWSTAIAPGANIWVASCADVGYALYSGAPIAAANLINGTVRPDIITASSYMGGESATDAPTKASLDSMWAQADAEGISVFVATGDSSVNVAFGATIYTSGTIAARFNPTIDANALATSPHVTSVGGTDLADVLDGTTGKYFAATPSVVGGSALSYVPEIPWNQTCGNGVAAKALGFNSAVAFCLEWQAVAPTQFSNFFAANSIASSGAPSTVDAKPTWQQQVHNAAKDSSRDIPDVALFGGSFANHTWAIVCTPDIACAPGLSGPVELNGGTELANAMFGGIQALIDQGLTKNGLPADQGNAAPTLYALAANEYGTAAGPTPSSLAACNADNGTSGTSNCVFHNVTRGSISAGCVQAVAGPVIFSTPNCYYWGTADFNIFDSDTITEQLGLTTSDAAPSSYGTGNKAFGAQPGWSFASGLGSVNATNLLIAWRAYVKAPSINSSAH